MRQVKGSICTQCPHCRECFTRIGVHLSKAVACRMKHEALQKATPDDPALPEQNDADEPMGDHFDTGVEDILPPEIFPPSPSKVPSKRVRVDSPDPFDEIHGSQQEPEPSNQPFDANSTFKLYTHVEFPDAGKVFQTGAPTFFGNILERMSKTTPYSPFANRKEWSLVEWLGTSGLSKNCIDKLLQTPWVCISSYYLVDNILKVCRSKSHLNPHLLKIPMKCGNVSTNFFQKAQNGNVRKLYYQRPQMSLNCFFIGILLSVSNILMQIQLLRATEHMFQ